MKISIDLDDTILVKPDFPHIESETTKLIRGCMEECFRKGTRKLFEYLNLSGHEVGIYTNSYRGKSDLENWFSENEFNINFVINQQIHDSKTDQQPNRYSLPDKCPHLFDIDIHIDDLIEIKESCEKFGVKIILAESSENWVEEVIYKIKSFA